MDLYLVQMFLFIIFPFNNGQTITYVIGVEWPYISSLPKNLPNYLNIVNLSIPVMNTLSEMTSTTNSANYDYILATYKRQWVMWTNQNNIPYLVIPEVGSDIPLPSNVFYSPSILQKTLECTKALLTFLNASSVVFLDYEPNPQFKNLVLFNNFTQTLIAISNTTVMSQLFVKTLDYNAQNYYVVAIPLSETGLIQSLLAEAIVKGQVTPGKVWIFIDSNLNVVNSKNLFSPFVNVGAVFFGYSLTFFNQSGSTPYPNMVVNDYVLLINSSIFGLTSKPSNKSAQLASANLTIGQLSPFSNFDKVTNQFNATIFKVIQANNFTNQVLTYTNNLSLFNVDQYIFSLNNSAVTVRVGVMLSKGYFMQKPTGLYYGYSPSILAELINITKFKYVYVFPSNVSNGSIADYDVLNSMIKLNLADIILIPMVTTYITPDADLSDSVLTMSINMVTRAPDNTLSSVMLAPFTYNVWFGILLVIVLLTLGFWAVSALSPPEVSKKNPNKNEPYTFGFSLLVIYSSFVMAKLKVKLLQTSFQVFAFVLWFSTLTLIITYASNLVPYLMKTNATYNFGKVQDLVNSSNTYTYVFVKNSIDLNLISADPILSQLYKPSSPQTSLIDDSISEKALLTSGAILIQNSNKNGYIYNTINCTSDMMRGTDAQYAMAFAINRNFKQKDEMKSLIRNLMLTGVTSAASIIYFGKGPCARSGLTNLPSSKQLDLNKLFILFILPVSGFVFGVGFVILKVLVQKCCRCIKNSNREPFILGKSYDAKVSSIENDGVWATINQRDRPYYINTSNLQPDLRRKYTPNELQLKSGDVIQLKYFGKDPINGYKRFCKDFSEA